MKILLLIPLMAMLASCSTTGGGPSEGVKHPDVKPAKTVYLTGTPQWKTMDEVKKALGSAATISGTKVDLKGNAISGKKIKHPSNSQDEDSIPLKIQIEKFSLENGIIRDIPGGVVVKSNFNTFKNLTFIESGEDFISTYTDGAKGTVVDKCKFYNDRDGDKSGQFNSAVDTTIKNSYFTGGITAIRLQESSSKQKDVRAYVEGNEFVKVPTAVNGDGDLTIYAHGNSYDNVREKFVLGPHAKVELK